MSALSLRNRLLGAGAVAVILALGVAAFGLIQLFGTHVERRALSEMSAQLDQVLAGLARQDGVLALVNPPADPRFDQPYGGLYWQIMTPDDVLRSRSLWDHDLSLRQDPPARGASRISRVNGPGRADLLVLEHSVILPDRLGGDEARALVAIDTADLDDATRAFAADMVPYLALLAAVLIAAQWVQVSIGLSPLRRIGTHVAGLRRDPGRRMGRDWPAEVKPMAQELDALLSAREADVERARARAGDLAHGLKTPLQALMGEAGRARARGDDASAEGIEEVAGAMRAHVERELARARSAARAGGARADVGRVVRRVVAVVRRTPDGGRLSWEVDVPAALMAGIDEADLAEALGALVENAARHARMGVTIRAEGDDQAVTLAIADDGPGLPPGLSEMMMARGVRADETGLGTGLGLPIARDIAQGAGGDLTLETADTGLRARLHLRRV